MEKVTQFVQTYSMDIKTVRMDGRTIDFSEDKVASHLMLPKDELLLEKMHRLIKKKKT